MGVRGLHTYVEGKLRQPDHTMTLPMLADMAFKAGKKCVVVVDGMALIRRLYTPDLEWVIGGQYQELYMNVQQFVRAFESHGLKLVVFLDGGVDAAKLAEWQSRRAKELQKVERVVNYLQKGEEPPSSVWMPPPNISKAVGGCFSQHGVAVYYTAGEADRELASYCVSNGCAAVLAKDSDFFVLPVSAYLNLDTLHLHASPPTVTVYRRQAVEGALSLTSPLMPLMGSLWFDGVVFEGMLAAASSAGAAAQAAHGADSCWASLLRGDEKLLRVFEELRPVALATEAEHHTKGAHQAEGAPADSSAVGAPVPLPAEIARNAAAAWAVALAR